jgi:hypothetical protein
VANLQKDDQQMEYENAFARGEPMSIYEPDK